MLAPWQRLMQQRARLRQQLEADRITRRIVQRPAIPPGYPNLQRVLDQLSQPVQYDDFLGNSHIWDRDLSPDQMAWQVEDELEQWDTFVEELKHRRKGPDS